MKGFLLQAERVLRGPPDEGRPTSTAATVRRLLGFTLLCGLLYGTVMGSYGGVAGDRVWQLLYSAVKLPLLLLATFVLSLPSFFVLNTLLGVRDDFAAVLRALAGSQAGLTIVLASLAPYTALWYVSFAGYNEALLFNAAMFAVASFAAQGWLRRAYRPLAARSRRHAWLLRIWLFLYAFVGIQMAWVLRPFIGYPGAPVQFFREESWGNAYVIVARLIRDTLAR
jgi:hypothetical protein